jgi:hypothetical protein
METQAEAMRQAIEAARNSDKGPEAPSWLEHIGGRRGYTAGRGST